MLSICNASEQAQALEQSAHPEAMVAQLPALLDNSTSPPLWPCKYKYKRKYVSDSLFPSNWRIYKRKKHGLVRSNLS